MKVGKPKSKRVPVRLRHKIEKASAAKQRKERKEAKKNPQWRSRLKKDPGIPNLFPYKDKVLAEIEEARRKKEEDAVRRRELAKAQRQGIAVAEKSLAAVGTDANDDVDDENDEDLVDAEDLEDDEAMDEDEKNPMAALLASAQARAHVFTKGDDDEDDEDDDDDGGDDNEEEWKGVGDAKPVPGAKATTTRKAMPKQALEDPIKAVSLLLDRLQRTQDGVQRLLDHYQIPPLVTAGSDTATRFLVEVARKRGRLGRGGIPNLPAAALTVLGDLNEERLELPSAPPQMQTSSSSSSAGKSDVRIVSQLAKPFRIEGLFGNEREQSAAERATEMEIEA